MGFKQVFHIIDDNSFVRELVSDLIIDLGYKTKVFSCPKDYIDFVSSPDYEKPVGIFTDITMPLMNGYEMINIVSNLVSNLKFVVMTGEPEIHSKYIAKSCMYLGKPFSPESIEKVVEKLITCHNSEPSCKIGCSKHDDRKNFPLTDWTCPNRRKECS